MNEDSELYRELSIFPALGFAVNMFFVFLNVYINNLPMLIMWGVGSIVYLLWFSWCVIKGIGERDG